MCFSVADTRGFFSTNSLLFLHVFLNLFCNHKCLYTDDTLKLRDLVGACHILTVIVCAHYVQSRMF